MNTKFAIDLLTYQNFKRTENTEPHRILRNRVTVEENTERVKPPKKRTILRQAQAATIRG
ncbi:hypothetical protein [Flavobacterium sp.]|uniref:hypothetical protein n=1 Tax=Flavobacterium sp. TaxID=239 RepID=UPI003B990687